MNSILKNLSIIVCGFFLTTLLSCGKKEESQSNQKNKKSLPYWATTTDTLTLRQKPDRTSSPVECQIAAQTGGNQMSKTLPKGYAILVKEKKDGEVEIQGKKGNWLRVMPAKIDAGNAYAYGNSSPCPDDVWVFGGFVE